MTTKQGLSEYVGQLHFGLNMISFEKMLLDLVTSMMTSHIQVLGTTMKYRVGSNVLSSFVITIEDNRIDKLNL